MKCEGLSSNNRILRINGAIERVRLAPCALHLQLEAWIMGNAHSIDYASMPTSSHLIHSDNILVALSRTKSRIMLDDWRLKRKGYFDCFENVAPNLWVRWASCVATANLKLVALLLSQRLKGTPSY